MKQVNKNIPIILLLFFHSMLVAQNPAIFKGGSAGGWISKAFSAGSTNIFKGGNADGWSSQNYSQVVSNIFRGGIGDGWDAKNYIQSSLVIYKGGIGDGWDARNFTQTNTGIFKGGIGDGWAATYLPQGPIPVNFLYFNAHKQGASSSLLDWKTSQEFNAAYFDVERSNDAVTFNYIGRVDAAGNSQVPVQYYFTDNQPAPGLNYYRLKQVDRDAHFVYTPARVVRFDRLNEGLVKYYPNPTNGILNIEITDAMKKETKVINVVNAAGIVLEQFKLENISNHVIPVSLILYPKGIYFIQIKTAGVNSTQRIVLQ